MIKDLKNKTNRMIVYNLLYRLITFPYFSIQITTTTKKKKKIRTQRMLNLSDKFLRLLRILAFNCCWLNNSFQSYFFSVYFILFFLIIV
jgi:hypothetical protein